MLLLQQSKGLFVCSQEVEVLRSILPRLQDVLGNMHLHIADVLSAFLTVSAFLICEPVWGVGGSISHAQGNKACFKRLYPKSTSLIIKKDLTKLDHVVPNSQFSRAHTNPFCNCGRIFLYHEALKGVMCNK